MTLSRASLPCVVLIVGSVFAAASARPAASSAPLLAGSVTPLPAAGPNRPASVPGDYVVTPFGYFHPSCVQSLEKGEQLLSDGRLQHADGTTAPKVAVCSYPRYTRRGVAISAAGVAIPASGNNANAAPEVDGWVESANIATGSATVSYGAILATWTVPPSPGVDDGQVLYFFPGLEDIKAVQSILQPVLGWYQGHWSVASWNCCLNGIVTNSRSVNVAAGDQIYGSVTSTCRAGTLTCATWNVLSVDLTTGDSTTLGNTPSKGQQFNWAFGGVLEAYYVVRCQDYPSTRHLGFDSLTLFDQNLHPIADPKWTEGFDSHVIPQCGYGVKTLPHQVTVDY